MTQVYDTPPPTPTVGKQRNIWKWLVLGCLGTVGLVVLCSALGLMGMLTTGSETAASPDSVVATDPSPVNETAPSPENEAAAASEVPAATPAPSSEEEVAPVAAAGIGEDVQVGDVRWKVLTAENRGNTIESGNEFTEDLSTSGTFVFVEFEVENLGGEQATLSTLELVDSQNRTFSASTDAIGIIDSDQFCLLQTLNPNVPRTCQAIYEVPADATGLALKVGDLELLGGDESRINLGF